MQGMFVCIFLSLIPELNKLLAILANRHYYFNKFRNPTLLPCSFIPYPSLQHSITILFLNS